MISMNRPSRGESESATTTRYDGCFFAPVRRSLILTDKISPCSSSFARVLRARQLWRTCAAERFHHLLRRFELFDQMVHVLDFRSAAGSDAPPAARIEDSRIRALLRRHRTDDGFDAR